MAFTYTLNKTLNITIFYPNVSEKKKRLRTNKLTLIPAAFTFLLITSNESPINSLKHLTTLNL